MNIPEKDIVSVDINKYFLKNDINLKKITVGKM